MYTITSAQIAAAEAAAAEVAAFRQDDLPLVTALASAFIAGLRAARLQGGPEHGERTEGNDA